MWRFLMFCRALSLALLYLFLKPGTLAYGIGTRGVHQFRLLVVNSDSRPRYRLEHSRPERNGHVNATGRLGIDAHKDALFTVGNAFPVRHRGKDGSGCDEGKCHTWQAVVFVELASSGTNIVKSSISSSPAIAIHQHCALACYRAIGNSDNHVFYPLAGHHIALKFIAASEPAYDTGREGDV